jgi:hypothetical protein
VPSRRALDAVAKVRRARRRHLLDELELDVRRHCLGELGPGAEQDRREVDRELVDEARSQKRLPTAGPPMMVTFMPSSVRPG